MGTCMLFLLGLYAITSEASHAGKSWGFLFEEMQLPHVLVQVQILK